MRRSSGRVRFTSRRVNWTLDDAPPDDVTVQCKIRYKAQAAECRLHPLASDRVEVELSEPLRDITPGQGAILSDGEQCLGGGIIEKEKEP